MWSAAKSLKIMLVFYKEWWTVWQTGWIQASRQFIWRLAWIQPVCISINLFPANQGLAINKATDKSIQNANFLISQPNPMVTS